MTKISTVKKTLSNPPIVDGGTFTFNELPYLPCRYGNYQVAHFEVKSKREREVGKQDQQTGKLKCLRINLQIILKV